MFIGNQNKYLAIRIRALLTGLVFSLFFFVYRKRKPRVVFNSVRNRVYGFNSKYLFEYMVRQYPDLEIKYVVNDKTLRDTLNKSLGTESQYFIETNSLKGIWYVFNSKVWATDSFDTPVGGVFLSSGRTVYHLGHGIMIKGCGNLEKSQSFLKRLYYQWVVKYNFNFFLVTSEALKPIKQRIHACSEEQLILSREPMANPVFEPEYQILVNAFGDQVINGVSILYAPTWRKSESVQLFPFDDLNLQSLMEFLERNNIYLFLRTHPAFEKDVPEKLLNLSRVFLLDSSVVGDVNEVLGYFDLLITDYSSVYTNYLLLNKPVAFIPYDLSSYEMDVGFVAPYRELAPGPFIYSMKEFMNKIERLLTDKSYFHLERHRVSHLLNDSNNGLAVNSSFIIEKVCD